MVIRIGGSVVASPVNTQRISQYAALLKRLRKEGHEIVLIVGGGILAREFIAYAKSLGLNAPEQDEAAISVSRLIAQLFVLRLGDAATSVIPISLDGVMKEVKTGRIVVMGGLKPGMTTDAVAAMVAESISADLLVKATNQEGVYTSDPEKHKDAEKIDKLSFKDLAHLFEQNTHRAGIHQIIDPEAVKILRKTRTKTIVVSGFKPENVALAIKGKKIGTAIE